MEHLSRELELLGQPINYKNLSISDLMALRKYAKVQSDAWREIEQDSQNELDELDELGKDAYYDKDGIKHQRSLYLYFEGIREKLGNELKLMTHRYFPNKDILNEHSFE